MPRIVSVSRARLAAWLAGFTSRHGHPHPDQVGPDLILIAPDGAVAEIEIPFGPVNLDGDDPVRALLEHVARNRRVGVILARKGGFAVGIFLGEQLLSSKVGSSYVQGRTKAGGWSQQRYARRRDNQSKKAYAGAAEVVAQLLLPAAGTLESVVTGGDAAAIAAVLADPRLQPLRSLVEARTHPTPDPRLKVLQAFSEQFLAVHIRLNEQAETG